MAPPRNHFAVETQQCILHVAVSAAVVDLHVTVKNDIECRKTMLSLNTYVTGNNAHYTYQFLKVIIFRLISSLFTP